MSPTMAPRGSGPSTFRTVADHLLDRLVEIGVGHVFGVPGDFTLGLLDRIEHDPRVEWVGTANELGAGYAADGYARLRGFGVVCTTFGVGELSAINAIAGSAAEHVPVLHLVGAPSTTVQAAGRPTHHSLGDGDFDRTFRMAAEVTVSQARLRAEGAVDDIDRVLESIVTTSNPGYLSLPVDVAELAAPAAAGPLCVESASSDEAVLARFAVAVTQLFAVTTARPVVLADIFVQRAHAQSALDNLLAVGDLDYASLLWGRRVIDESGAGFLGTYIGGASRANVREAIEHAGCLLTVGVQFTDLISGFFSQDLDPARRIDIQRHRSTVAGEAFDGLTMVDALDVVASLVTPRASPRPSMPDRDLARDGDRESEPHAARSGPLTQAALWDAVAAWLRPGDVVLADQGTSYYGMGDHPLPRDVQFIGQPLWASIGYTLPAMLGAALAAPDRRPVLLIGDGAAQLTIQELGTIIRQRIPALIIIVDNDGYTVERAIRSPSARYNDIGSWRWADLPHALGASPAQCLAARVDTSEQLHAVLSEAAESPDRLTLVQAVTARLDVPPLLDLIAHAAAAANRSSTERSG